MKKIVTVCSLFAVIIAGATVLYQQAITQPTYNGLPTVSCIDNTKPIVKNFSFFLKITVDGKPFPLSPTIGHDAGNCLHNIFVTDASGQVYVRTNDNQQFRLGQFFDVWHKTFTDKQFYTFLTQGNHHIRVVINGKAVEQYRDIILQPNQIITVIYQ